MTTLLLSVQQDLDVIGIRGLHELLRARGEDSTLAFMPALKGKEAETIGEFEAFVREKSPWLVGISLMSHEQLGEKLDQIGSLPRVNWCAVVTGRYDIIVEIVCQEGMDDLYEFLDQDLSKLGGITASESFVVMKSRRKWLLLPDAVVETFIK